jgi:hypothetical protein
MMNNENVAEFCNPPEYYKHFGGCSAPMPQTPQRDDNNTADRMDQAAIISNDNHQWPQPPRLPTDPKCVTSLIYGNAVRIQSIAEQNYDPEKNYRMAFERWSILCSTIYPMCCVMEAYFSY